MALTYRSHHFDLFSLLSIQFRLVHHQSGGQQKKKKQKPVLISNQNALTVWHDGRSGLIINFPISPITSGYVFVFDCLLKMNLYACVRACASVCLCVSCFYLLPFAYVSIIRFSIERRKGSTKLEWTKH